MAVVSLPPILFFWLVEGRRKRGRGVWGGYTKI